MSTTIDDANATTDAALAARRTEAAETSAPAKSAPKSAPRKRAPKAPAPEFSPAEEASRARAVRPPTATIAAYVAYLDRVVFDGSVGDLGKLSDRERRIAALSITLYGAYQASPERRAARGL